MNAAIRSQEHVVYRMYGKGERLLYIGFTNSMKDRLRVHQQSSPWFHEVLCVTSVALPNRNTALLEEAFAIRAEQPLYNIRHTGRPQKFWSVAA